jgi:hypothetical protein
MIEMEKGHEAPLYLAMVKALRELMHDINDEVESWNVPLDATCDAAALQALEAKSERQKALQEEREEEEEYQTDLAIQQLLQQEQRLKEHKERFDKLLAGQL